jgi:hypothetical protein
MTFDAYQSPLIVDEYNIQLDPQEFRVIQDQTHTCAFLDSVIPSLHEHEYLKKKTNLIELARRAIIFSHSIPSINLQKICHPSRDGRVLSETLGIYKKDRAIHNEALVWELSVLLDCDRFIAPSIPIHIYGSLATFQPFIPGTQFARFLLKGMATDVSISQADFWILSVFVFLIGHSDLNGTNLYYNKNGFQLIDNDGTFPESNIPLCLQKPYLYVPLQNALIDLDRAYVSLGLEDLVLVQKFLQQLKCAKKDIETLLLLSPLANSLSDEAKRAFWERCERIVNTEPKCGMTHYDFACQLFPEHFMKINGVIPFLQEIWGVELGPVSALHLIGSCLPWMGELSLHQKEWIYQWIGLNFGQ